MASTPLDAAYNHCRRIHRHYGKTFYLATLLLPRERQRHVHALYAFARVADEMVDSPAPTDAAAFTTWSADATASMRADEPPDPLHDPVLAATWHTLRAYDLDPHLLEEFLASMTMDLDVTRYETWEQLRVYMRGSAAVIGELMSPLLGASGADARRRAGLLGEAFQLTNFIRDVAEDWDRGRVYLPQEDLRAFGVGDRELAECVRAGAPTDPVRRALACEIARARTLYAEAAPGIDLVDRRARPCLRVASRLYSGILDEVEKADLNVFAGRLAVPRRDRARAVLTSFRSRESPCAPGEPTPRT